MNERYVVESVAVGHSKGQRVDINVAVAYNLELDRVFGSGYAFKCARLNAKHAHGTVFKEDHKGRQEIKI